MKLLYRYLLFAGSLSAMLLLVGAALRLGTPAEADVQDPAMTVAEAAARPQLAGLTPNMIAAGSPGFTMKATGAFFTPKSIVQWNGQSRPTAFVDGALLLTPIPASDVAAAGLFRVTVVNPPLPDGRPSVSNVLVFRVAALNTF